MQKLPLRLKEKVMDNLFSCHKHVSRTKFIKYLVSEGIDKKEAESISGLDGDFKSSLSSLIDMKHILGNDFSREDAEKMIQDITIFGGDKKMLKKRLHREFSYLTPEQLTSLTRLSYDGWGRLSRELLVNLLPAEGDSCEVLVDHTSGEVLNIISAMRQTSYNLMELLGSRFGYGQAIEERNRKEEGQGRITYKDVEDLYISPAVRRPLWQALKIVREIVKITGKEPSKIFIEMARENGEKGRRTISRKARLQALYKKCRDDTRDWAKELEGKSEEDFRSDRLYLYYTQMGRSMYTGKPIDINRLFDRNVYDIDHIYPQSLTGDDSLDNRVLVEKTVNAKKGDTYPLSSALDGCYISGQQIRIQDIQKEMRPFWHMLLEKELISKEKYNRLSRTIPLSDAEKAAFIGRQLVETRQSTKACAELLSKAYPQTRIVYTKAGNASRFRQYGGFIKVRDMNDYHHAKDAYLNIVVGNVFDTRFTANPLHFLKGNHPVYSLNTEALYGHKVSRNGVDAWIPAEKDEKGQVIDGHEGTMGTVRKWMRKNNILFTRMPLEGKGGLFDQNIMKKGNGQVPLKGDSPISDIEKYGGYNKASIAYMMLVQAEEKGKPVYLLESIPNYVKNKLTSDKERQEYCVRTWTAQGNKYRHPQILIPKVRIQSLFEIDGFKAHISGKTDDRFVMRNAQELCMDNALAGVLKNILKFIHRKTVQKDAVITEYDGVSDDNTLALYDFFVDKLSSSIYGKKFATQADFLRQSKDKFMNLPLEERCEVLGSILHLFQCNAVLSDFHLLGGSRQAGRIYLNKKIKAQDHVYLIEQSVTGFFEKRILLAPFGEK